MKSEKRTYLASLTFLASRGIYKMSFLEMTKLHLARQEDAKFAHGYLVIDGHLVKRMIWKTESTVIFQDTNGHFWQYSSHQKQTGPVVLRFDAEYPLTPP